MWLVRPRTPFRGYRIDEVVMALSGLTRRALDVAIGGVCLLVLAPVMVAIAVGIRVTSRGPALFRQTRVGQDMEPFVMFKFRTMRTGCSDELHRSYVTRLMRDPQVSAGSDGLFKLDGDPRVTRFGVLLRRASLDELPQLFNVLRGEMSLVGPRPMLPWEVELLAPDHRERFAVPAGMTGLWQVNGRNRLTMTEALDLDVEYVRIRGLAMDLRILARTARVFLHPEGTAR